MEYVVEDKASRIRYLIVSEEGEVKRVVDPVVKTVDIDGEEVVLLYDSSHKPIPEISAFFMDGMATAAENTRDQAKSSLRLLVAYCEIRVIRLEDFDIGDARGYLDFLRGLPTDGFLRSYRPTTRRTEETLNSHLKHIRNLCRYLGLEGSPFLKRKQPPRSHWLPSCDPPKPIPYEISAGSEESPYSPEHVSLAEYKKLLFVANTHGLPGDVIIIRLMFEHGARRGECLGLTLEDIRQGRFPDGTKRYYLILRDRPSDARDQHAKGTSKVLRKEDCETRAYRERGVGYQELSIGENLYHVLLDYIEAIHGVKPEAISLNASADEVDGKSDNRYAFLNTRGGRLAAGAWGKRLRKLFRLAGIHVDTGGRKTNLSHRLRHGYAMVLKHLCGFDERTIKILMRHRRIKSQEPYTKPTPERVAEVQQSAIATISITLTREDLWRG